MVNPVADRSARARGFIAALLGWAFDGLDSFLYTLVALPVVTLLMPGAQKAEIAATGGLIQAIFLVGWAVGGLLFGRIGDLLGRTRTLTLTIVIYALFTGLSAFAQTWEQLAILRFIAALGIGGEWAAGSALVSETLAAKYRPIASATLQSGYMVGMILAALSVGFFAAQDPRMVFLVGVIPAFVTIWIRKAVPEPREWEATKKEAKMPPISDLFRGEVLRTTVLTLVMSCVCLTSAWAFLYFGTALIRAAAPPAQAAIIVRNITIEYTIVNIAGNFLATFLARAIGHRKALFILLGAAMAVFMLMFRHGATLDQIRLGMALGGLTALGVFGIFPLYIPPLFPTLLRTTGAGFCYNIGRVVAGIGTYWLATNTSAVNPSDAIFWVALVYIPGLLVALMMPELDQKTVLKPA